MNKVLCTSGDELPIQMSSEVRVFTLFKSAKQPGVGTIAQGWRRELKRRGFAPSTQAWDFVQFCLSVCAADASVIRSTTSDGWTRKIELSITLSEPSQWQSWKQHAEEMLKVLTGDYWSLNFLAGGALPPDGETKSIDNDCVSLLSGGLDSLIGGINLVAQGRSPIFVSQLAHEDSQRQRNYAALLGGAATHRQWSHAISFSGKRESSTRARSLAFYGFAVIAASQIASAHVQVFVPENGFICINPPLVPGRVSSLSTKTTHPLFIRMLQELVDGLGVPVRFELPYRFKTKGQMMRECLNQTLLRQLAADSTSCGRFRTYNRRHCGRCVPCMIRRAAFRAWDISMDTTPYVHMSLVGSEKSSGPDDPMAAALSVLAVELQGLDRFLGASLAFALPGERASYRTMLGAGINELHDLLSADGLL